MSEKQEIARTESDDASFDLMTDSASDILRVSPVPSVDESDTGSGTAVALDATRASHRTLQGRPPISPSPLGQSTLPGEELTSLRGAKGERNPSPNSASRHKTSTDAFSSSSEEDPMTGSEGDVLLLFSGSFVAPENARAAFSQSEFDKALISGDGIPNTGSASFDVPKDGNADDIMLQAEQSASQDAISNGEHALVPERTAREPTRQSRWRPRPPRPSSPPTTATTNKTTPPPPPPPPPQMLRHTSSIASRVSEATGGSAHHPAAPPSPRSATASSRRSADDVSTGVLPDVLMTMRQKIESLTLFDSDMMRLAQSDFTDDDRMQQETREQLKRSSQQSISASVLVSLAHKRYDRRRLAAMEIEKVVRSLVPDEMERVRAILLLLSDDYVRSTSEDARKGGVVALAACAIGLKKAPQDNAAVLECRDLILASVVHACQDHMQRVRYYATESLFNVLKAIPALAVQHFFILFEILRSLYADVDVDVRSGAQLLDKRLKEWIVGAINSGSFTADACVPIFARFVYMRNKATKRLTLSWLHELNEKLLGAPVLEFLHLFLSGIFAMVADPNVTIRESALMFLQGVLPKLLQQNAAIDDSASVKVDFDKLLQGLVTTLEHPDPFVRKVAMYWMSRIFAAHMGPNPRGRLSPASISVRNSLPHVLPGILLSIGDTFHNRASKKDSFLPDQTTRSLAEQTNICLQEAVRRDGTAYVTHLDGFIMALREELDSPGGVNARNPPSVERKPYRMDVAPDGTGIESPGWFRTSEDKKNSESMMLSRLCALQWVIVLYESVVPDKLKAEYAREFISPIIRQLVDSPPNSIIRKSLEVLAIITVPVKGEDLPSDGSSSSLLTMAKASEMDEVEVAFPMTDESAEYALHVMPSSRHQFKSRDRQVFRALIHLHARNHHLLADLSKVLQFMCELQPPEFVFVSFAVELDRFARKHAQEQVSDDPTKTDPEGPSETISSSRGLEFVSAFVQQMSHILFNTDETAPLRDKIRDCIGKRTGDETVDTRKARLFHILLYSFSHNLASTVSLCLWGGAYLTASWVLTNIDPLDIGLTFLVEADKLIETLERPLFRHLRVRMLERDKDPAAEGSGTMLFQCLMSLLMIVPQSTCYRILQSRLLSAAKFRQTAVVVDRATELSTSHTGTEAFVARVLTVRQLHCDATWRSIRAESLETPELEKLDHIDADDGRREWLGYSSREEEAVRRRMLTQQHRASGTLVEEITEGYDDLDSLPRANVKEYDIPSDGGEQTAVDKRRSVLTEEWKEFWAQNTNSAAT